MRKLHFMNVITPPANNIGDWWCSPIHYYYHFFKQYNCIMHDLSGPRLLELGKDDVVIIGAGGVIDWRPKITATINQVFDKVNTVIGWGIGSSTTKNAGDVDCSRFTLLGWRDYNDGHGYEYLPCVTCRLPELSLTQEITREVGLIEHGAYKLPETLPYERSSNRKSLDDFLRFIASSECIVTRSYHAAQWSQWMGKKVIIGKVWSGKFKHFRYQPEMVQTADYSDLPELIERAKTYPESRSEAIWTNDQFFLRVKALIEERISPCGTDYQRLYEMRRMTQLFSLIQETKDSINSLKKRVVSLEKKEERE